MVQDIEEKEDADNYAVGDDDDGADSVRVWQPSDAILGIWATKLQQSRRYYTYFNISISFVIRKN